jgi:hypothetical protein
MVGSKGPIGTLTITPPTALDKECQRDGIEPKSSEAVGERAYWLSQIVALVPLPHWSERFQATPAELISAAADDDFGLTLIEAWSMAALRFADAAWSEALWDWWYAWEPKKRRGAEQPLSMLTFVKLLPQMSPAAAESRILQFLQQPGERHAVLPEIIGGLPRPWSESLSRAYLRQTRELVGRPTRGNQDTTYAWATTLTTAARRLSPACLAEARQAWELPESDQYGMYYWRRAIEELTEIVRLRSELAEALKERGKHLSGSR